MRHIGRTAVSSQSQLQDEILQVICCCWGCGGWKPGPDTVLGSFSKRWKGEMRKRLGHFCRSKMVFTEDPGCVFTLTEGVRILTEANYCSSCQIHPELLSEVAASLAANEHVKLHWISAVLWIKSLQFIAGVLQPVNNGTLSLLHLSL